MDLRLRLQLVQLLIPPGGELAVGRADRKRILGRRSPGTIGKVLVPAPKAKHAFREPGVIGISHSGGGGGETRGANMAVESWKDGHTGDDDADKLFAEFQHGDGRNGDGLVAVLAGGDFVAESNDAGYDGDTTDEEDS